MATTRIKPFQIIGMGPGLQGIGAFQYVRKISSGLQHGLAPFYEPRMIEYYMRTEKITREEATKKVKRKRPVLHYDFDIYHTEEIYDVIYVDEISRTPLKVPKHIPAYLITFGDIGSNYSIYIPGKTMNAILSEYTGDSDSSWVNLRFGKCRKQVD